MAASRCVYTKIQLKLLETEVEDGAEEAEVTRKLLGHYLSSDSKSQVGGPENSSENSQA